MTRRRAPSPATCRTLAALLAHDDGLHGYDITRAAGVKAGTLYPMLIRLEQAGLLDSAWETSPMPGRPARHVYRLTPKGRGVARALASNAIDSLEVPALKGMPA
jgi:PadR family transcriptional regulator, regulatory protein PadR